MGKVGAYIYYFRDKCVWTMNIPPNVSWTMRKILKLRDKVQPWITYKVGNGNDTFLWLDNWHPSGPLYQKYGEQVVHNLGRSFFTKVSSIIQGHTRAWPRQRNPIIMEIM